MLNSSLFVSYVFSFSLFFFFISLFFSFFSLFLSFFNIYFSPFFSLFSPPYFLVIGNHPKCEIKKNLYSVSGLGIHKNILYVISLCEIYSINAKDHTDFKVIINKENNNDYPFYDNVTFYENYMNVAVYSYGQKIEYDVFKNGCLLKMSIDCFSNCLGVGYFDKTNLNREQINTLDIKFLKIDLGKINNEKNLYEYEYITFDQRFPEFDNEVTQITQISDTKYILNNYKAKFMLLINTVKEVLKINFE